MGVYVKFWKGAWWVFVNHQGRRKAKRIGDRETALRVAKAIRIRLAAGDLHLGAIEDDTLEGYAAAWLKRLTGSLKASTIAFYAANLRPYVLPALGRRQTSTLTRADCASWSSLRAKGLKLNTVRGIVQRNIVRGVLTSPKSHQRGLSRGLCDGSIRRWCRGRTSLGSSVRDEF